MRVVFIVIFSDPASTDVPNDYQKDVPFYGKNESLKYFNDYIVNITKLWKKQASSIFGFNRAFWSLSKYASDTDSK